MSRSYKHTPVYKVNKSKYNKRCANKKVRREAKQKPYDSAVQKSNLYRREYESWDICDYRFWGEPIWREDAIGKEEAQLYGKGSFFLLITAEEWNHDADEWLGIYVGKKEAREAYDRASAWYEAEREQSGYSSQQKVVMVEYIPEENRFRTVDRQELD